MHNKEQEYSLSPPPTQMSHIQHSSDSWHTISARIRKDDLPILNKRLQMNCFKTFNEFVNAWIKGEYPRLANNEQIEKIITRLREGNIRDPINGEFSLTFYRSVSRDDMLQDLSKKYVYKKHAKDLVSYFDRYCEIFFANPDLIRSESGHKRGWICDAMRRFGEYYDRKFSNPQLKILISEIIHRYELNKKLSIHDRLWLVDENHLSHMISRVLQIAGELGVLIRFALFTGLRGEEIGYLHKKELCNKLFGCNCSSLHVIEKKNGHCVIIVNRIVGQKHCYFTIAPTKPWLKFRATSPAVYEQRKAAHAILKSYTDGQISFMDLRKFHYNVLCRSEMKESGAEVLQGSSP